MAAGGDADILLTTGTPVLVVPKFGVVGAGVGVGVADGIAGVPAGAVG